MGIILWFKLEIDWYRSIFRFYRYISIGQNGWFYRPQ